MKGRTACLESNTRNNNWFCICDLFLRSRGSLPPRIHLFGNGLPCIREHTYETTCVHKGQLKNICLSKAKSHRRNERMMRRRARDKTRSSMMMVMVMILMMMMVMMLLVMMIMTIMVMMLMMRVMRTTHQTQKHLRPRGWFRRTKSKSTCGQETSNNKSICGQEDVLNKHKNTCGQDDGLDKQKQKHMRSWGWEKQKQEHLRPRI